jgi:ABC-type phosphate transport system substrate-binding protein
MTKRIRKLVVAVAALAALALGGAVFAQAQTSPSAAPERTSVPDRDNVRSGDQTTPDVAVTAAGHARHHATRAASSTTVDAAGGGTGRSGDQSTPDTGSAGETPGAENPETGAGPESASANDGPGGHADPPGEGNADHQFQGNE